MMLYLKTIGALNDSLLISLSYWDSPYLLGLWRNYQYGIFVLNQGQLYDINSSTIFIFIIIYYQNIMTQLIKINKIKGKQNKKKWRKNIDVSGLMQQMEKTHNEEMKAKFQKPLIVEDTTLNTKQQVDPNRFRGRARPQPKKQYDNSYEKHDLIQDVVNDPWAMQQQGVTRKNKQQLQIPAIVKPKTGHSYNPKEEHIEQIIDEVIDYEKRRPKKQKKIKKMVIKKVVPRARNKKVRQEYLDAIERKKQRANLDQINSMKKVKKDLKEKQQKIQKKINMKQEKQSKQEEEYMSGKVRDGPKLGKQRYHYKQYIPSKDEVNKKLSKVGLSDELVRDRYDSIFRRGMMEQRNVKVHANKTKNIKVIERARE